MSCRIQTYKESYVVDYPEAVTFAETQQKIFWLPDEIKVEKDIQDMKVNMSEAESHGVIITLKLFTLYELFAGDEYWGKRVTASFPRHEIKRMASVFSSFELGVHAPFYDKLNKALGLDNDQFYTSYVDNPILKSRMEFIDAVVNDESDLISTAAFSMVEGVILYSNFAFLKHFQSQGKNLLNNVVAGINFSVRDENLHSEAGAWLYRTLKAETEEVPKDLDDNIIALAEKMYEHESEIIDMLFGIGPITGITAMQLKNFAKSRINLCLKNIEIAPIYEVTYNPIASWFYGGINSVQLNDFFNRVGNEYNRDWSEGDFKWQ